VFPPFVPVTLPSAFIWQLETEASFTYEEMAASWLDIRKTNMAKPEINKTRQTAIATLTIGLLEII
jgi:hypothetical protein